MNDDYDIVNIGYLCDTCAIKLCEDSMISLDWSDYDINGLATSKYYRSM